MNARVVAVTNQEGGVGKTTTTINLAASLALADQQVLVVDVDPQANLTSGVGPKGQTDATIYHALTSDTPDVAAAIVPTTIRNLSLMPADRQLTGAEVELVMLPERERRLKAILDRVRDDFDVIFVDEHEPHLNPLGVKGLGEIGIVGTAAAIANAVHHATGVRVRDLPISIDKILELTRPHE